jgi:hypothetical protein
MKKQDMHTTDYVIVSHGATTLIRNRKAGIECSVTVKRMAIPFGTDQYDAMYRTSITCDECGQPMNGKARVMGGNSGKVMKCGGICRGAKGPACDCPCEGVNHGANY